MILWNFRWLLNFTKSIFIYHNIQEMLYILWDRKHVNIICLTLVTRLQWKQFWQHCTPQCVYLMKEKSIYYPKKKLKIKKLKTKYSINFFSGSIVLEGVRQGWVGASSCLHSVIPLSLWCGRCRHAWVCCLYFSLIYDKPGNHNKCEEQE